MFSPRHRSSIDFEKVLFNTYSNSDHSYPMAAASVKLEKKCMVPREGHIGNFPANFCIKIMGVDGKTRLPSHFIVLFHVQIKRRFSIQILATSGELLVIRRCVLEDMGDQCGTFVFEGAEMKGCILTCDYDGCNGARYGHQRIFLNWQNIIQLFFADFVASGKTNFPIP